MLFKHAIEYSNHPDKHNIRYDPDWLLECLLLRIRSPSCYDFLRNNQYMPLPDRTTLQRCMKGINCNFGFDQQLFLVLKKKLQEIPEPERKGVLIWDEISLQKHVEFNKQNGYLIGLSDFGSDIKRDNIQNSVADHALVFLFQPHMGGWCQSIGTFCAKGATPGKIIVQLLLKSIIQLENCGASVTGVVCDGSTNNKSALSMLGISGDMETLRHSFLNPVTEKKIFVFIDVPHIIKCIRNMLLKYGVFNLPNGEVKMAHFRGLLEEDEKFVSGLRIVPKLQHAHISPNVFQKMTVCLATQLFSESVANGLEFYRKKGVECLKDCEATIQFVRLLNALFDSLNRKFPHTGIRKNSQDLKIIANAIEWLDTCERYIQSLHQDKRCFISKQTCESLRITLYSVLSLSNSLLDEGFFYVLTNRFCQDPLERFFGMIRQISGGDSHPTTVQFIYLYRLMSVYSLVKPPRRANVEYNAVDILVQMKSLEKKEQNNLLQELTKKMEAIFSDPQVLNTKEMCNFMTGARIIQISEEHNYSSADDRENIIYFLGGFVARQLLSYNCNNCKMTMITEENDSSVAFLTNLKSKGGLLHPSEKLHHLLTFIENQICKHLGVENTADDVYFQIIETILADPSLTELFVGCAIKEHAVNLTAKIIHFYLSCRMHFFTRVINCGLKSKISAKQFRKMGHLHKIFLSSHLSYLFQF